jgi:hypothetical protein
VGVCCMLRHRLATPVAEESDPPWDGSCDYVAGLCRMYSKCDRRDTVSVSCSSDFLCPALFGPTDADDDPRPAGFRRSPSAPYIVHLSNPAHFYTPGTSCCSSGSVVWARPLPWGSPCHRDGCVWPLSLHLLCRFPGCTTTGHIRCICPHELELGQSSVPTASMTRSMVALNQQDAVSTAGGFLSVVLAQLSTVAPRARSSPAEQKHLQLALCLVGSCLGGFLRVDIGASPARNMPAWTWTLLHVLEAWPLEAPKGDERFAVTIDGSTARPSFSVQGPFLQSLREGLSLPEGALGVLCECGGGKERVHVWCEAPFARASWTLECVGCGLPRLGLSQELLASAQSLQSLFPASVVRPSREDPTNEWSDDETEGLSQPQPQLQPRPALTDRLARPTKRRKHQPLGVRLWCSVQQGKPLPSGAEELESLALDRLLFWVHRCHSSVVDLLFHLGIPRAAFDADLCAMVQAGLRRDGPAADPIPTDDPVMANQASLACVPVAWQWGHATTEPAPDRGPLWVAPCWSPFFDVPPVYPRSTATTSCTGPPPSSLTHEYPPDAVDPSPSRFVRSPLCPDLLFCTGSCPACRGKENGVVIVRFRTVVSAVPSSSRQNLRSQSPSNPQEPFTHAQRLDLFCVACSRSAWVRVPPALVHWSTLPGRPAMHGSAGNARSARELVDLLVHVVSRLDQRPHELLRSDPIPGPNPGTVRVQLRAKFAKGGTSREWCSACGTEESVVVALDQGSTVTKACAARNVSGWLQCCQRVRVITGRYSPPTTPPPWSSRRLDPAAPFLRTCGVPASVPAAHRAGMELLAAAALFHPGRVWALASTRAVWRALPAQLAWTSPAAVPYPAFVSFSRLLPSLSRSLHPVHPSLDPLNPFTSDLDPVFVRVLTILKGRALVLVPAQFCRLPPELESGGTDQSSGPTSVHSHGSSLRRQAGTRGSSSAEGPRLGQLVAGKRVPNQGVVHFATGRGPCGCLGPWEYVLVERSSSSRRVAQQQDLHKDVFPAHLVVLVRCQHCSACLDSRRLDLAELTAIRTSVLSTLRTVVPPGISQSLQRMARRSCVGAGALRCWWNPMPVALSCGWEESPSDHPSRESWLLLSPVLLSLLTFVHPTAMATLVAAALGTARTHRSLQIALHELCWRTLWLHRERRGQTGSTDLRGLSWGGEAEAVAVVHAAARPLSRSHPGFASSPHPPARDRPVSSTSLDGTENPALDAHEPLLLLSDGSELFLTPAAFPDTILHLAGVSLDRTGPYWAWDQAVGVPGLGPASPAQGPAVLCSSASGAPETLQEWTPLSAGRPGSWLPTLLVAYVVERCRMVIAGAWTVPVAQREQEALSGVAAVHLVVRFRGWCCPCRPDGGTQWWWDLPVSGSVKLDPSQASSVCDSPSRSRWLDPASLHGLCTVTLAFEPFSTQVVVPGGFASQASPLGRPTRQASVVVACARCGHATPDLVPDAAGMCRVSALWDGPLRTGSTAGRAASAVVTGEWSQWLGLALTHPEVGHSMALAAACAQDALVWRPPKQHRTRDWGATDEISAAAPRDRDRGWWMRGAAGLPDACVAAVLQAEDLWAAKHRTDPHRRRNPLQGIDRSVAAWAGWDAPHSVPDHGHDHGVVPFLVAAMERADQHDHALLLCLHGRRRLYARGLPRPWPPAKGWTLGLAWTGHGRVLPTPTLAAPPASLDGINASFPARKSTPTQWCCWDAQTSKGRTASGKLWTPERSLGPEAAVRGRPVEPSPTPVPVPVPVPVSVPVPVPGWSSWAPMDQMAQMAQMAQMVQMAQLAQMAQMGQGLPAFGHPPTHHFPAGMFAHLHQPVPTSGPPTSSVPHGGATESPPAPVPARERQE